MRTLRTVTFVYDSREDRVLAAINAGLAESWSCWLTRRVALALLERTGDLVASTSAVAQRVPSDLRGESIAFEREAAIASTAKKMSNTPSEVLKSSATGAVLAQRLTISRDGENFRLQLIGAKDAGAAGVLTRAELQRVLQMLQIEVTKAGWLAVPATPAAGAAGKPSDAKPLRN